jgi:hypothetical protein
LSRKKYYFDGNDTIDRYPLPHEGRLKKILCISKEVFKELKAALAEFGFKPKTSFRQKLPKKEPLSIARSDDRKSDKDECIGSFEPSNILETRNSLFWRLRNLNAWFKEQESYEDSRYVKSHRIKIG